MAKVYLKFNSAVIKEFKLEKDEISIGRKPGNDIFIDHPTVSGFHGKIKKEADHFVVEDLNSTNGTFINGRRVKSGALKDKDQIGIAGHILDFHIDNNAVASVDQVTEPKPTGHVMDPATFAEKQKEILRKSLGLGPDGKPLPVVLTPEEKAKDAAEPKPELPAGPVVRIISGGVNGQVEAILKDVVTYIGTTDQALIKIKGFLAPDLAAAISRRPEGYFLKAVKAGYPKVNGLAIKEQILLENGALIEAGGTNMVFYRGDTERAPEKPAESNGEKK